MTAGMPPAHFVCGPPVLMDFETGKPGNRESGVPEDVRERLATRG